MTRQCPSCGGDCGYTKAKGCQYKSAQPCPTCEALARSVMCDQVSDDRRPSAYAVRQITDDDGVEEWEDIFTSPDVAREEADAMEHTGRGERFEVVPLYTIPRHLDHNDVGRRLGALLPLLNSHKISEANMLIRELMADLYVAPEQHNDQRL